MRSTVIATALVMISVGVVAGINQQPSASTSVAQITYDKFMQLDPQARRQRFAQLSAEEKAWIKRTHAERWLTQNRSRLSAAQIAVANEAIAFVTPQLYLQPNDPDLMKREEALRHKLTCVLGKENTTQAFVLHASSASANATGASIAVSWFEWFADCVLE